MLRGLCHDAGAEVASGEIVRFAQKALNENMIARDRDQVFSRDLWEKCRNHRPQAFPSPRLRWSGCDGLTTAIALEALGYGCKDSGFVFSLCAPLLSCVVPLWKHGSEAQKRRGFQDCATARSWACTP